MRLATRYAETTRTTLRGASTAEYGNSGTLLSPTPTVLGVVKAPDVLEVVVALVDAEVVEVEFVVAPLVDVEVVVVVSPREASRAPSADARVAEPDAVPMYS